jgi:uncharacterized membrane protein
MNTKNKRRNIAVIAYLTFIGLLVAFYLNRDHKYEVATYHIKNMFGLVLLMMVSQIAQSNYYMMLFGELLWVVLFILWVISIYNAFQNEKKAIPWLSDKFQVWFTFLN